MPTTTLDHPTFARVKAAFPGKKFRATEFRECATLIVEPADLHEVMAFLKTDPECAYNFLSDVIGIDYLGYPAEMPGRFVVVYNLCAYGKDLRFFVKVFLNPSIPTEGIEEDPALYLDSVTDLWAGAEWPEREVYDMLGIRFRGHPDLRRILTDYGFEGHPFRKDFPLTGYVELRYSPEEQRVVYEPVKLAQDLRQFDFMSPWEGAEYVLPGDEKAEEKK